MIQINAPGGQDVILAARRAKMRVDPRPGSESETERWVLRQNIALYEGLLRSNKDPARRRMIAGLLDRHRRLFSRLGGGFAA